MSALLIFVNILLAIVAIVLIVAVLAQEGTRQGLGAITGGAETFFGKNKARSIEGKLELITKIGAAAFIVLAIVSTILTSNINKSAAIDTTSATDGTVITETTTGEDTTADETADTTEGETADEATESADGESAEG